MDDKTMIFEGQRTHLRAAAYRVEPDEVVDRVPDPAIEAEHADAVGPT